MKNIVIEIKVLSRINFRLNIVKRRSGELEDNNEEMNDKVVYLRRWKYEGVFCKYGG